MHFNKAGGQLFKARELDGEEQLVLLGYGQLEMVRGDYKAAKVPVAVSYLCRQGSNQCGHPTSCG